MDESTSCIRGTDRIRVLSCRHSVRSKFPLCQKGKINILQINSLCNISQFHSYHLSALYSEPLYLSDISSLRMFTQTWRGHTQKAWVLGLWREQVHNKKMYIGTRCEFKCQWEATAAITHSGEKQEYLDFHARVHFLPAWLHVSLWGTYTPHRGSWLTKWKIVFSVSVLYYSTNLLPLQAAFQARPL